MTWAGAAPPLGGTADHRKDVRRAAWIAPLAIGFFLFMAPYLTVTLVATLARERRTMPHRPAASRPAPAWRASYTEP